MEEIKLCSSNEEATKDRYMGVVELSREYMYEARPRLGYEDSSALYDVRMEKVRYIPEV